MDKCEIVLEFSSEVHVDALSVALLQFSGGDLEARAGEDASMLILRPVEALSPSRKYTLTVLAGESFGVDIVEPYTLAFTTEYDRTPKFPEITDEELLTLVQQKTFDYFWSHGHPVSGLARERLGSGNTVTAGGSGFGIMTLPVAVERGFVTRAEAAERLRTIVTFLRDKADRFHGVYPHWMNGETGKVIPFSSKDKASMPSGGPWSGTGTRSAARRPSTGTGRPIRAGP